MKISELKQPYRRMAEYLVTQNCMQEASHGIYNFYKQGGIMDLFCNTIGKGEHPQITEEIKKNFPPDFDFSGEEEIKNKPVMQMLDLETQKFIYTQLAKEGKFDELPDTCEFSEPVELEVSDFNEVIVKKANVVGKFKSKFVEKEDILTAGYIIWNFAQLPRPKIDLSQFKAGDVVEVELSNEEKRIGWFDYADRNQVVIKTLQRKGNQVCNGGSCSGSKMFNLEKIKLITKIK